MKTIRMRLSGKLENVVPDLEYLEINILGFRAGYYPKFSL